MSQPSPMALLFVLLTVAFTVIGQLSVKQGMLGVGGSPTQVAMLPQFIWRALTNLRVLFGLACAVAAALSWIVAISRSDLSFAYPFMGLAIVLVLALSGVLFGETVPITRWLGVVIVCLGLVVTARS